MDNVDKKKLKQNILTICQQDFVTVFELCGFSKYHGIYIFNIFTTLLFKYSSFSCGQSFEYLFTVQLVGQKSKYFYIHPVSAHPHCNGMKGPLLRRYRQHLEQSRVNCGVSTETKQSKTSSWFLSDKDNLLRVMLTYCANVEVALLTQELVELQPRSGEHLSQVIHFNPNYLHHQMTLPHVGKISNRSLHLDI